MIRQEYKDQLIETRKNWSSNREWGSTGDKYVGAQLVEFLSRRKDIQSVLDFGCGLGKLGEYVKDKLDRPIEWHNYDPSIVHFSTEPKRSFDLIVSSDVMEHIEPQSLDETLTWIAEHATRSQFHAIACGPTTKTLPDGRDVHLIQQPIRWWQMQLVRPGWMVLERAEIMQVRKGTERHRGNLILDRSA